MTWKDYLLVILVVLLGNVATLFYVQRVYPPMAEYVQAVAGILQQAAQRPPSPAPKP